MNSHPSIPPELRYEPCLDNIEPYNDMERQICDFLFQNVVNVDWRFASPTKVEVEAKLGSIKDWNDDNARLRLPILTDVVLDPQARSKFESSMKLDQHARLNKYLNSAVQQSQRPDRKPIEYKHLRETDYFYDIPQMALHLLDPLVLDIHNRSGRKGAPRLRVTRDNVTDKITAVIVKTRLQDMEVRCPNDEFDFRVSISLETQWIHQGYEQFPEHLDHGVRTTRSKDRLSYRHQGFLVDLTQVTPFHRPGEKPDRIHELEIEMDVDKLMEEGYKNLNNQPNQYTDLVHVFLNNVKVVTRAAKAPPAQQQQGGPPR
jgi:polynucleotide 5'-triphosphatase